MKAIVGQRPTTVPPKPPMAPFGGTLGVIAIALGVGVLAAFAFDWHSHVCVSCGAKWSHLGAFNVGSIPSHTCRCGTVQWWKAGAYDTDGAFHMNDVPAPTQVASTLAVREPRW